MSSETSSMDKIECDVLVAGSGAAGLTAAFTAAERGLDVIVVEKEPVFGGTTAYSAGVIWIPGNSLARQAGLKDSPEDALTYIKEEAGEYFDEAKARAFVEHAPRMLDHMLERSHVRYQLIPNWADYHPLRPGASSGGRSLLPEPFDGRRLGERFRELRVPISTMMLFGGMSVSRSDIPHLFNATRSLRSGVHVLRLLARYARDRLSWPRGTAIANGNALVARLALSLFDKGVPIWTDSPLVRLIEQDGRVSGGLVRRNGRDVEVVARKGVILASGGFPRHEAWRRERYPHVAQGKNHVSLAPPGNTGDGAQLAQAHGAGFSKVASNPAAWTPVSQLPNGDGTFTPYPHFIDRCKPGFIAVDRRGQRFANEADSYHDFVPAMVKACAQDTHIEAFLICDHATIRRYGMGVVPPFPMPIQCYIDRGYLIRGDTLAGLAGQLGIEAQALSSTVQRYNGFAHDGKDLDFGKGSNVYNHFGGDPSRKPNPNLAPIERGPFYAVRLEPSDLGTFQGLQTDEHARVLCAADGEPIPGLYAVGNDMASVMGGAYPGAGITIGPAMTFAYIAARHLDT
jgi:succinate dehydrogenase/fumarate reductase flavoprotein subunit